MLPDDVRADWEERIGRRGVPGQEGHHGAAAGLARPAGLRAVAGQGHVTLDWDPVPGAAGYLVYRAAGEPYQPLDHGGGDVLAVPAGPYADTSGEPGRVRHYAVAAVADGASAGPLSDPVAAAPLAAARRPAGGDDRGRRRSREREPRPGLAGAAVGTHDRLGAPELPAEPGPDRRPGDRPGGARGAADRARRTRRAGRPGARHPGRRPRGVHRSGRSRPVHDFTGDRPGVRPADGDRPAAGRRAVLHARATWPATRARRCSATGRSSRRPRTGTAGPTWSGDLAAHLMQRYGRDEVVSRWAFEVWNEPNLEVFWSGTPEEYFRLYDVSARAIKSVRSGPAGRRAVLGGGGLDRRAAGPPGGLRTCRWTSCPRTSTATCRWTCGRCWRRSAGPGRRSGGPSGAPRPTHFHHVGDTVFAAAFLLRGMASALGRIEALSHWVASDHFEELGAAAGAVPRRVRAAVGGEPAQAPVLGDGPAGPARPVPAAGRRYAATGPAGWSRRWPRGTTTGGSGSWPGTSRWTRARSAGTRCWTAGSGCGCRSRPGRRMRSGTTGSTPGTPTSSRPGSGCATARRGRRDGAVGGAGAS